MNIKRTLFKTIALTCVLITHVATAKVDVTLSEPIWLFNADTKALLQNDARLEPQEQGVANALKPVLASQDYQQAALILQGYKSSEKSAALWQVTGQVYLALKRLNEAENAFKMALKLQSNLGRSERSLAVIYLQQQQPDKAIKHLSNSVVLGQQDDQLFGQLGYLHLQNNNPWAAISGYQNALLLAPQNSQWQQGLLVALIKAQLYPSANAMLSGMLEADSDNKDLWLQRSQIALQQDNELQALSSLEVALRLGEKSIENRVLAAQLHLKNGSFSKASVLLAQVLKQDQQQFSLVSSAVAWLLHQQEYKQASKLLAKVTQPAKLSTVAKGDYYTLQGQLANAQKNTKKAASYYQKALAINPSNGQVLLALGDYYRAAQAYSRAELYYIRAQGLSAFKERALVSHAQLEIDQTDYKSAVILLRKALAVNPSRYDIAKNIAQLERLTSQSS